jgi:2-polyprenyl-3-methyl-5-hydroxy-6-metoxy-1,4-benzoquinol methylase
MTTPLREQFGDIDIYLFDQLLRGTIAPGATVLDAGCGNGRNVVYLLRAGYTVLAADERADAVAGVRAMAATLAPHLPATNFRCEPVEAMSFADGCADVAISSASPRRKPREMEGCVIRYFGSLFDAARSDES